MTLTRLLLRRNRLLLGAWSGQLIALAGGTVWSYQSTYPTPELQTTAVRLARANTAATVLYGTLSPAATPAAMFVWEIGAFTTVLAAVMAVLAGVALSRATEDEGSLELFRSTGIDPWLPLRSALTVLATVAVVLAVGSTGAVGLWVNRVDGVTWPGAAAFGAVVGVTFLVVGAVTLVLAQVMPSAAGVRAGTLALVGACFAARAYADTRSGADTRAVPILDRVNPLSLRGQVRPFEGDRWWVLVAWLATVPVLAILARVLAGRRELGAGLVPRRDRRGSRLNVRTGGELAERLLRRSTLTWAAGVATLGTLFAALGAGTVQQSRTEHVGGFLGSQLGVGDPVAGYLDYVGTVIGILAAAFAVLAVSTAHRDERAGRTDHLLTTGIPRWTPLGWQVLTTAAALALVLGGTALLTAAVAPQVLTGRDVAVRALGYVLGQWPATLVMAGWAALVVGCAPRWTALAWVPLGAGGVLALLGALLGVPRGIRDLGPFEHVPDLAQAHPDVHALVLLLVVAVILTATGLIGITRRDVRLE